MNRFKKFWIVFVSFLPISAGAMAPFVAGLLVGGGVLAGFSIYRSNVPVNIDDAMNFFSSCWSCEMFSNVVAILAQVLPKVYKSVGLVMIPFAIALLAIWFAWNLISTYTNGNNVEPWSLASEFGTRLLKLGVVIALLLAPLPRIMSDVAIEPIFAIGTSLNHAVTGDDDFNTCIIATAMTDRISATEEGAAQLAFSPKLRHSLSCELASIHQMTGIGMTAGWTMMNMSFDDDYMHKIMWRFPIFPNVPLLLCGFLIIVLFFTALLPVPVYFLEIFIKLTLDLIMLPLSFLSWIFPKWSILPDGTKNIKAIIDDVVQGALGIAFTGIFVTFSIMFINAAFGEWNGVSALKAAMEQNDSKILIDGIMMNNDTLVTIVLMGAFLAMFMTAIPALVKTLFNVQISDDFYKTTKSNLDKMWSNIKKINKNLEK